MTTTSRVVAKPKRKASPSRTKAKPRARAKATSGQKKKQAAPAAITPPEPPQDLGAKAQQVWLETVEAYELRSHELRLLEDACREIDLIERMEKVLKATTLIVEGSQGQPVESPLVKEIRQHRLTYQRLIGALDLPDDEEPPATRTTSARAAAMARWSRARGSA